MKYFRSIFFDKAREQEIIYSDEETFYKPEQLLELLTTKSTFTEKSIPKDLLRKSLNQPFTNKLCFFKKTRSYLDVSR